MDIDGLLQDTHGVLHDVGTSSLHIYDIYLVSGNGGQVYEGRGTWDLLPVPGALDLVSNFGVEKVITYEQTTGVAFGCPCLSDVLLAWSRL